MPSMAAFIGVEKSRRDFLGRWAYVQHGSQDYVLMARQIVRVPLRAAWWRRRAFWFWARLREHGHSRDDMAAAHAVMQWDGSSRTWKLGGSFPAFQVDPARIQASAGRMDAALPGPTSRLRQCRPKMRLLSSSRSQAKFLQASHVQELCCLPGEVCRDYTCVLPD